MPEVLQKSKKIILFTSARKSVKHIGMMLKKGPLW